MRHYMIRAVFKKELMDTAVIQAKEEVCRVQVERVPETSLAQNAQALG